MTFPAPPLSRNGFRIAIVCALPLEAGYVQSVFDKCWDAEGKHYGKAANDQNSYTTGVIGRHNVVLSHMPSMGTTTAAAVAVGLRSSFTGIQLALVVGICGVMPICPETKEEIILGDIIVSTSIVQYDFGKRYPDGFKRKAVVEDSSGRASLTIRAHLAKIKARPNLERLKRQVSSHLVHLQAKIPAAIYPGVAVDRLYEPTHIHGHRGSMQPCDKCHDTIETCPLSCDEIHCGNDDIISRARLTTLASANQSIGVQPEPSIHFGILGSANTVMKSGAERDRLAKVDGMIAFEMEGAGVGLQFPTVVIKGACDYADSHKNNKWQEYAAATAAACVKAFLEEWVPEAFFETVLHVPFDHIQGFVGRAFELRSIKEKIINPNGNRVLSLLGLGGVGKSRLALEIAYQTHSEQPEHSVFWIQATDPSTFARNMVELGTRLQIPGIAEEKADVKNLIKQRLSDWSTAGRWLLILDSADDEGIWGRKPNKASQASDLEDWLPRTMYGTILITTRSRRVASHLAQKEVTELHEMSPSEASDMFTNILEKPEMAADQEMTSILLERLTYLPLAIVQAAAYMNMNMVGAQTYLELMEEPEESLIELLSEDFGDPLRYANAENPVATTWLVSFQQIRQQNTLAAEYLAIMACFHEKNIPLSLLPEARSKKEFVDAVAILKGYSFVAQQTRDSLGNDDETLYDMHRLVHFATRSWLKQEGSITNYMTASTVRLATLFPPVDYEHRIRWTRYLPHAQRLCAEECVAGRAERYILLQKMGLCLLVDGKYNEAVEMHTTSVMWMERIWGTTDPRTWDAYKDLGEALKHQGKLSEAEQYCRKAFEMRRDTLGLDDHDTLLTQGRLASVYWRQGKLKEAEELNVQVAEIRKRVFGQEHPETTISQNNLAEVYQDQGRYKEAEELNLQIIKIRKRVLGQEHPDTLMSQSNLALNYYNQGRWKEAEELNVRVITIRKQVQGHEHPDTLIAQGHLATAIVRQGRWKEAEKLEVEVLDIRTRTLGQEHPQTLSGQSNLALNYYNQGRLKEAEELNIQVIEIAKRVLGQEHPNTLGSQNNLANVYTKEGRWEEAEKLQVEVTEIVTRILGQDHPHTLTSRDNLAVTYQAQGRLVEAEKIHTQTVDIRKRVQGQEHPDTLRSQAYVARVLKLQGQISEALVMIVDCAEASTLKLGCDHPDTQRRQAWIREWRRDLRRMRGEEASTKRIEVLESWTCSQR